MIYLSYISYIYLHVSPVYALQEEVAHRLNQMVRLGIFSSNAEVIASLFTRPFEVLPLRRHRAVSRL